MAIIPLRQEITVTRTEPDPGDIWGGGGTPVTFTLKCRVVEGSYITTDVNAKQVGGTIVATAKILLDNLVDIRYGDEIAFTNELGNTIRRKPLKISVLRDFSGKPLLTEVLI